MKIKKIAAAAAIATMLLPAYSVFAQWDEDEEQQRIEDRQREDVLYQDSEVGTHDENVHMPKKRRWQPPPPPEEGKYKTPAEEIEGTSTE